MNVLYHCPDAAEDPCVWIIIIFSCLRSFISNIKRHQQTGKKPVSITISTLKLHSVCRIQENEQGEGEDISNLYQPVPHKARQKYMYFLHHGSVF